MHADSDTDDDEIPELLTPSDSDEGSDDGDDLQKWFNDDD